MQWVWEVIIIIELISKTVSSETPGFLWKLSASLETNLFSSEAQNNIWQRFLFWAQPSRFSSETPSLGILSFQCILLETSKFWNKTTFFYLRHLKTWGSPVESEVTDENKTVFYKIREL